MSGGLLFVSQSLLDAWAAALRPAPRRGGGTTVTAFEGFRPEALAVKIAQEEPTPIDKLRPNVPASLRRVVERTALPV